MLKHNDEIAEEPLINIADKIKTKLEQLELRTIVEQVVILSIIFEKTFKGGTNSESYAFGLSQIKNYVFITSSSVSLSAKETEAIYQKEFVFITQQASSIKSLHPFIFRMIASEYLFNLENGSFYGFPKGERAFTVEVIQSLRKEITDIIYSSMESYQGFDDLLAKIPKTVLKHILNSPFYTPDLKMLLLKAEDPLNRKGFHGFLNISFPYSKENQRLVQILKVYILSAYEVGLSGEIKALDKNLPIRDSERIYKIISEITGESNPEVIHGDLRKIFAQKK